MPNERSLLGVIPETGEYQTGDVLLRSVLDAQGHNRLLLSFSCGKDSLAMWLWLRETQAVKPGTAMPQLGVTERDARDIAAYLGEAGFAVNRTQVLLNAPLKTATPTRMTNMATTPTVE